MISVRTSSRSNHPGLHLDSNITSLQDYNHETLALGGYRGCKFSFLSNLREATEWAYLGLGSDVVSTNRKGVDIWNGIVDKVTISVGSDSIEIGPLMNVSNRIQVNYNTPSFGGYENSFSRTTDWYEDAESVKKYTRLSESISGGEAVDYEAVTLAESALEEKATPAFAERLSTEAQSGGVSITIDCAGYTRLMEKQIYNTPDEYFESGGTAKDEVTLDTKVRHVVGQIFTLTEGSNPPIGNFSLAKFDELVYLYEDKDRSVWGIIEDEINKLGLSRKIICGYFANRTFQLRKIDYRQRYQRVMGTGSIQRGNEVLEPSEVVPGVVLVSATLQRPIEYTVNSVSYSMNGDRVSINQYDRTLRAVLEKAMLGGRTIF